MYYSIEDIRNENITNLRDLGGTATLVLCNNYALLIRISDDSEKVFYQFIGNNFEKIEEADVEYFSYTDEIGDMLNMTSDEFEDDLGGVTPGFNIEGTIYLILEFMRDM